MAGQDPVSKGRQGAKNREASETAIILLSGSEEHLILLLDKKQFFLLKLAGVC